MQGSLSAVEFVGVVVVVAEVVDLVSVLGRGVCLGSMGFRSREE